MANGGYKFVFYAPDVTVKQKLHIIPTIKRKLGRVHDGRLDRFRVSCFGPWLDIRSTKCDGALVHRILQTRIGPNDPKADELRFHVGGHNVRFGREDFCLVTGFRFGRTPVLPPESETSFRRRLLVDKTTRYGVKLEDILTFFKDDGVFDRLLAEDAVRICLLVMLEIGFLGKQTNLYVTLDILSLAEFLDVWDTYPWGSYIWTTTIKQLRRSLPDPPNPGQIKPKYTLSGHIWAFKIWIVELFQVETLKTHYNKLEGVIPRAVAWTLLKGMKWSHTQAFVAKNVVYTPLVPTAQERDADWWLDSWRYIFGRDYVFQDPPRTDPSSLSPHQRPLFSSVAHSPPPFGTGSRFMETPRPPPFSSPPHSIESQLAWLVDSHRRLEDGQRRIEENQRRLAEDQSWKKKMLTKMYRKIESSRCRCQVASDVVDVRNSLSHHSASSKRSLSHRTASSKRSLSHHSPPSQQSVSQHSPPSQRTVSQHSPPSQGAVPQQSPSSSSSPSLGDELGQRNPMLSRYQKPPYTNSCRKKPKTNQETKPHVDPELDVYELYHSGFPFTDCYLTSDPIVRCEREYWGLLLGVFSTGWLESTHVDAWIKHLMASRPFDAEWTIVPSLFFTGVATGHTYMHKIIDGSLEPWIALDCVRYVFTPINIPDVHWFLGVLDLHSWHMILYDSYVGLKEGQQKTPPLFAQFNDAFPSVLQRAGYWSRAGVAPPEGRVRVTYDYVSDVPQQPLRSGHCSAFLCMFLEHLSLGRPVSCPEPTVEAVIQYRRYMANVLYRYYRA